MATLSVFLLVLKAMFYFCIHLILGVLEAINYAMSKGMEILAYLIPGTGIVVFVLLIISECIGQSLLGVLYVILFVGLLSGALFGLIFYAVFMIFIYISAFFVGLGDLFTSSRENCKKKMNGVMNQLSSVLNAWLLMNERE